jgi:hypothetical protein
MMWWIELERGRGSRRRGFLRRRNERRGTILNVRASVKLRGGLRENRAAAVALCVVGAAVLAAAAVVTWRAATDKLFVQNRRFVLTSLQISGGTAVNHQFITERQGIHEGTNLFAFSIGRVRRDFLQWAYNVKAMDICRVLPNTLKIEIVERTPLARIGWRGPLAIDREGMAFPLKSGEMRGLPRVLSKKESALKPGSRVTGMALAAIELLDVVENPALGVRVESIDVDSDEYLVVHMPQAPPVRLAWRKMGEMSMDSKRSLQKRLGWVVSVMQSEYGRRLAFLDATYDGKVIGQ